MVTYDEHGGFYDHVAPPRIASDERANFQQLGFRVPTIVAGPKVRAGAAVSVTFDHVSIVSTLTRRFGLPPLNQRVRATADLSLCLDPSTSRARQAPQLDAVEVSLSALHDRIDHPGHHVEIAAAADLLGSRQLDRRSESLDITNRVLRYGERLGAVRLVY